MSAAIVPIFNNEEYLPRALDSLLAQSLEVEAIFVVCDSDRTAQSPQYLAIRRKYQQYSKIHWSQTSQKIGPTSICDRIIRAHPQFDRFLIQDADDWSHKNRHLLLSKAMDIRSLDVVGSDEIYYYPHHNYRLYHKQYPRNLKEALIENPQNLLVLHWHTCLISREFYLKLGGAIDVDYVGGGIEFIVRAIFNGRVACLPEYLYYYRQLDNSFLRNPDKGSKSPEYLKLRKEIEEYIRARS